jgi:hypothetical protein
MARKRERDIRLATLPADFPRTPGDPQATILMLYEQLEGYALAIREWYLADKRSKRRYSRFLRAMAIILAAVGGLAPLAPMLPPNSGARWGYVFLALAAACVAFDRIFGLSTAWMRDIAGAQAADTIRAELYAEWARIITAGRSAQDCIERQLALLEQTSASLGNILTSETSEWRKEFESSLEHLKSMVGKDSADDERKRRLPVTRS